MKKIFLMLIVLCLSLQTSVFAKDLKLSTDFTEQNFKDLVKDLGSAISFNPLSPAEPLGLIGFDMSIEATSTKLDDEDHFKKAFQNDAPSSIIIPRLHIQKGLPFGIDVGAMYSKVPSSNISLMGVELKYAILKGDVILPAIAVRGAYSKLNGVDDLDLSTLEADLMISKGILMFTPYAGVSAVRVSGKEKTSFLNFKEEEETITKTFIGLQITPLPLLNITVESSFGDMTQYGLKLGFRF